MPPRLDRRRRTAVALVFSVQDRRRRARALQENRQRKAALLSLDTHDVAHRLNAMRPPDTLMDVNEPVPAPNPEDSTEEAVQSRGVPTTYEQWAQDGFPTDCWRPLLGEELYHPLEAEQEYLKAKYSPLAKKRKEKVVDAAESPLPPKES